VFSSYATDLVPGDVNGQRDVFVRDMVTGRTTLASVGVDGAQGNGESRQGSISADGRFVAFSSNATNLVPGDTNDSPDVFVRDLRTGATSRVSIGIAGQADQGGGQPEISSDGRHVTFTSGATNLVAGDTNDTQDVFVRDLDAGRTERVSVSTGGLQSDGFSTDSTISADGRFVAFVSASPTLAPAPPPPPETLIFTYVHDRKTNTTRSVSHDVTADRRTVIIETSYPVISADGRFVVFTVIGWLGVGVDPIPNVWLRDLTTDRLELVTADRAGNPSSAVGPVFREDVSADGRYVAFGTPGRMTPADRGNLSDVFRLDRQTGSLVWITYRQEPADPFGGIGSVGPAISADGNHVAFESDAVNLVRDGGAAGYDTYLWRSIRRP
jgi:Tol biopolymer transport system component